MNTQPPFFDLDRAETGPGRPGSAYPGGPPSGPQEDDIDVARLLGVLWSGKIFITLAAIIGLAVGAFQAANTPLQFRSDALLQLESRPDQLGIPSSLLDLAEGRPSTTTEIELLRSRMVLGQAVTDMNLDWRATPVLAPFGGEMLRRYPLPLPDLDWLRPFGRPGESIEIEFLQVPPAWLNRSMNVTVTEDGFRLVTPDGATLNGRVGETLSDSAIGFGLRLAELQAPPGREFRIRQESIERAVSRLNSSLSIRQRGSNTGILQLTFSARDQAEAVTSLTAIAQAYVSQNVDRSAARAQSGLDFIDQRLPDAEEAVSRAARALNSFQREQGFLDLSVDTQNLLGQISRAEGELRSLAEREEEISQRLTPNHPTYRALIQEREVVEERLERRLAELREQAQNLPETQQTMLRLTRDLNTTQSIYNQMQTRAQELRFIRASTIGNVRIVDSPVFSGVESADRNQLLLMGLAAGLLAGAGLVLLRNWLRRGVQTVADLEKVGLPVFATINYTPHATPPRLRRVSRLPIVTLTHPEDLAVEAFRSLRTSLHFGMLDASSRSLSITSAAPEAGKSFSAVNLAVVAAQAGQQVALVDADMRRGQLRKYFGLPGTTPGLAEYLSGSVQLEEVLIETEVPGLWFLPAGRYPPNPSELLMRRELSKLVGVLSPTFELSIFDTPPTLAVTDATIVGRATGATVTVVRHDQTTLAEVQATRKALEQAGVRMAGCILNGFDPRKTYYGQHYGYAYRYTYKTRAS